MKTDRVVLFLDNKANLRVLEGWLKQNYDVRSVERDDALEQPFDLAIVDGRVLNARLKRIDMLREGAKPVFLPFLLTTPRQSVSGFADYLGRTVDEIVVVPIDKLELQARIENLLRLRRLSLELEKQRQAVARLSVTDDVSGFHNTRFLHQYLDDFLAQAERNEKQRLSLVFFDMDGFKTVVDTHGHPLGAKVLREVAEEVNRHLDPNDEIVRYGGDEYVVILPGQDKEQALNKIERVKEGLTSTRYLLEEGIDLKVTASFGLATFPHDAKDKKELLAAADDCLFQSKARGKNRISMVEQ